MILSSIVAMGKNRVIGKDNTMMWNIPSEYEHYRTSLGSHFYIIGRKNYQGSLSVHRGQKALVLSRQKSLELEHPVFSDFKDAVFHAKERGESELFILGGEEIYRLAMPFIHRLYLSIIDFGEEGDTYFPKHEEYNWRLLREFSRQKTSQTSEVTPYSWDFRLLEKDPLPLF